jgi:uncharacterized SAM-binding protein YcdF (DUF218 family)
MLPCEAEEGYAPARPLIERVVASYGISGERDKPALFELVALDPALGLKWMRILDLWETPVAVNSELPDDLPKDDSLCLVALGYRLNTDGSMRNELIERLKVVLAASQKYPNAFIICTGGATAINNPSATEAGRMAEWLRWQGVEARRLIVEDQSLTTAQNAAFSFEILADNYPQIRQLAIISSDYHIATGALLFGAAAILRDSDISIVSNAAWHAPSGTLSPIFQANALLDLPDDMETAYEIYYNTYGSHELPPLSEAVQ